MPQLPWEQIWILTRELVAPALAASLVVMLVLRLAGGERLAPLAAAAAVAAGVVAGNYFRKPLEWQLDADRPLAWSDFRTVLGWSLESKPPTAAPDAEPVANANNPEPPPLPLARYWLPWLALLALVTELLVGLPVVPPAVGWIARTLVAVLAARLLTPPDFRLDMPAVSWLLAAAMILEWAIMVTLARHWQDSTIPLAAALCLAAASLVLLSAGSARYMDIGMLFSGALLGPALLAWMWRGDTSPAAAAAAVFLPGLLLLGYHDAPELPPIDNFLLVALAPLALAPMALPSLIWQRGWLHWLPGLVLPLIPAAIAVAAVVRAGALNVE